MWRVIAQDTQDHCHFLFFYYAYPFVSMYIVVIALKVVDDFTNPSAIVSPPTLLFMIPLIIEGKLLSIENYIMKIIFSL